jgi:tRNA-Thr(GGU) m(6)t(6)A37 methyltransferase TsaA
MTVVEFHPIGIIHTPYKTPEGAPIQPRRSNGAKGTIDLLPEYEDGLKDVDGFSHLVILYHLHLSTGFNLQPMPFLDDTPRGLFATRAPRRPNPIGLSVVRLVSIDGCRIDIRDVDMIDGTPLLDIKPHIPDFEPGTEIRTGWLAGKSGRADDTSADDRFTA